ncbi:PAAR domain-containing protein [Orbus wheelerorum]|uniref:PAAR domain-containing protein n=1 Tax=Orbus wheelerorum TaxID=3074111 RepID=UPI00370DBDEB
MRSVIRLGDSTDHGGQVISASSTMMVKGKGVARVGDKVSCPRKGHGVTAIIEGDSRMKDQGQPIALDGHHAGCGCALISSLSNVGIK